MLIEFKRPTIVLASNSPRRERVLREHNIRFVKFPSPFDDSTVNDDFSHENVTKRQEEQYAKSMTLAKLQPFIDNSRNAAVITADTTVLCMGRILEKPITRDKCREQHQFISGKKTVVYTAIAVYYDGKVKCDLLKAKVRIKPLPPEVIEEICNEDETLDCAGFRRAGALRPYAVFSKRNKDSRGISIPMILKMLRKFGFPKSEIYDKIPVSQ